MPDVIRKFGAVRDVTDRRDLKFKTSRTLLPSKPNYSLFDQLGLVKDQLSEGSCTGHAGSEHAETLIYKAYGKRVRLSPAFLYYKERELEGTLPSDDGAESRSIFRALNKFGCCLESSDPYNPFKMNAVPTPVQLAEAALNKIGAYHRIESIDDIESCLISEYTCTLAVKLYQSFQDSIGVISLPNKTKERELGGHEMLIWGFDTTGFALWNLFNKPGVMVRNSWSSSWGLNGDCLFPFEYFKDPDLWMDSWVGHFGPPWKG